MMLKFTRQVTTSAAMTIAVLLSACGDKAPEQAANSSDTVSFNQHIRPILNKNCTGCHGGVGKQADVSFIYREEALGRGHYISHAYHRFEPQ